MPRVQAEGPKLRFPALMKRLSVVVHAYKDLGSGDSDISELAGQLALPNWLAVGSVRDTHLNK